jgi:DNA-directed RNA polymerase specialized sigma24 family protein
MPGRSDQSLLHDYAAARARGDDAAAAAAWRELAVNNFDRIKQSVKLFRFSPGGPRLPEDEHGSAASEAYLRVIAMGADFRSREVGAFYAALHNTVLNSCKDFGRKELRHARRAAGSLDSTYEPDGAAGPYDAALAAYDAELRARGRDAVETERDALEAEQLVRWAIGRVANDNYRAVLERTYGDAPMTGEQIAADLGITAQNVYQRRRRGGQELEGILRGI